MPAGVFIAPDYQEQRRKAEERSIELLRSWLTPEQLADYDAKQSFIVRGSETGERYLIKSPNEVYNVVELDDANDTVARFCFVPSGDVKSFGDIMLAQKIMLETDELEARAIANRMRQGSYGYGWYAAPAAPG